MLDTVVAGDATASVGEELLSTVDGMLRGWAGAQRLNIGFPGATDFDLTELLSRMGGQLLNNVGDPTTGGAGVNHTKQLELQVVDYLGDLFRAPPQRWGYVTSGGSEGNLYALWLARSLYSDAMVYHSDAAHSSVDKAVGILGLGSIRIVTDRFGQLDYADLAEKVDRHRDQAAIVVATVGTTMTEAFDDVRTITAVLDELAVRRRFIHADAALSGIPLALTEPGARWGFDFADGADSIAVSGHKFIGCPIPCGVLIVRDHLHKRIGQPGRYTGAPDTTLGGSRSGLAPLLLWYRLHTLGVDGLRARAERARSLAAYLHARLVEMGWPAHHFDHAMTVLLRTPPKVVTDKWVLANHDGWSHVVTMPGITVDQIEEFLTDLHNAAAAQVGHDEGCRELACFDDPVAGCGDEDNHD
jgi:histidine decarboxylase